MGIIVRFPRKRHVRASINSRAASEVSKSADTRAALATSVANIAAHHSAGTLSRCHHLETAEALAPTSEAIASRESPQSSISARNDVIGLVMPTFIGPIVLKRKAILSLDGVKFLGHTVHMAEAETETQYKQRFMARVAEARIARGLKQWQLAEALGMAQDKYKQYESRSLLPHHLIGRFCIVTRVDPEWLVTGRGQKPLKPLQLAEPEPEPIPKPKRGRTRKVA